MDWGISALDTGAMEKAVLAKLDAMFHDLRQANKLKHLREVHNSSWQFGPCHSNSHGDVYDAHQQRRFSLPTQTMASRRDSLPKLLLSSSSSSRRDSRRSSLPILPARRDSKIARDPTLSGRRDSLDPAASVAAAVAAAGASPYRKFSRDSIDEDVAHLENTDSIIFEEDEDGEHVKEVPLCSFYHWNSSLYQPDDFIHFNGFH